MAISKNAGFHSSALFLQTCSSHLRGVEKGAVLSAAATCLRVPTTCPIADAGHLFHPTDGLAGFVFVAGRAGWAFVSSADPIPRRRFTAAHELGHFILHRDTLGRFLADTDATLREADEDASNLMEREANRFAAELLMPEDLCRERAIEFRKRFHCCPRGVLIYRLSSELLVSQKGLAVPTPDVGGGR